MLATAAPGAACRASKRLAHKCSAKRIATLHTAPASAAAIPEGTCMCAQGLGCPQDRYCEYEICAAGAARVNLGVYYMPGQLQYRQPQTVLAQYLRQSLLNGTFVNVNLVQQVLIHSLEQSCKSRAGACFAVPALCQTWQPLHGSHQFQLAQQVVICRHTSTTSQGTAACCWRPSTTLLPCASSTAQARCRHRRCRRHPGDAVVQPLGCALELASSAWLQAQHAQQPC